MFDSLKRIFRKEKELAIVDLRDKLENHFLDCVNQRSDVPGNSLSHNPIIGGGFGISKIYLVHNNSRIGWLERMDNHPEEENILKIKHFGMDTAYTKNEYAIHMIKGFAKTVKKQFPHIDYLDFLELLDPDIDQAVAQNYLKLFHKLKMTKVGVNTYRYTI